MKKRQSDHHLRDRKASDAAGERRGGGATLTSPASLYRSCRDGLPPDASEKETEVRGARGPERERMRRPCLRGCLFGLHRGDKSVYFCEEWDMAFSGAAWAIGRAGREIIFLRKTTQFIRSLNCAPEQKDLIKPATAAELSRKWVTFISGGGIKNKALQCELPIEL